MQIQSNVYVGIKPSSLEQNIFYREVENNENSNVNVTNTALLESCDYVLLAVTNDRYREQVLQQLQAYIDRSDPFERFLISEPQLQDIMISPFGGNSNDSNENSPSHIGLLSSWVDLENEDILQREMSYQVLLNECKLAQSIGINKLILAPPHDINNLKIYSQMISRVLNHDIFEKNGTNMILSVSLPMYEDSDPLATWDLWNNIRKLCGYHPSLMVSLALPRVKTPHYILDRWLTEPVSSLLLSSSIFATNQYNYPVLHKFNQNLLMKFQEINGNSQLKSNSLVIILHGMEKYKDFIKGGESAYLEYINFLLKRNDKLTLQNSKHYLNKFQLNQPQLMSPLKPHSENLTNSIYSIFETDLVKYEKYGEAIKQAMLEIIKRRQTRNSNNSTPINILVAGAGRGPLVSQVYNVSQSLNVISRVQIIALEKNPQAFLYLQKRNFEHWNNNVQLIHDDMSRWKSNDKIDLCISELLGSLGCNELSPECLWNIEQNHSKPDTIFIPQSYTSSIAPITAPLVYQKLTQESKNFGSNEQQRLFQEPWIMHGIPFQILSNRVNEIWTFEHPNKIHLSSKTMTIHDLFNRNVTTEFKVKHRGEIHGIAGFFSAHLYGDTYMSIVPDGISMNKIDIEGNDERTKNLFSWSPLVFPLKEPLLINDDTEVSIMCSRQMDGKKVWYEWSVESYVYLVLSKQIDTRSGGKLKDDTTMLQNTRLDNDPDSTHNNNSNSNNKHGTTNSSDNKHNNNNINNNNNSTTQPYEFESAIDENGFMPTYEDGWQSVQNMYEELGQVPKIDEPGINLQPEEEEEEEVDINVRVKTGVSQLHNVNGQYFSVEFLKE
ncbi:similar to Saccharomyces cerevisiae YBR133C HSL7 Protein arginine N-methyltransferase that exhibits septin and Hsl1p-dependent bud neck localization and periodic Hsl1p-dependent phosphorylation [Maudiozyma saulgeensis]|uniref:Similar to Saccharomyces cerevisiae YBR133C HSL7 Protein arginine N-methyltransferase that exhibits septin and Hsl1p-dependent bud neck localization and periodic Hsl1p-dependent phosphorylation n=1 Tax=Maudiozyma saulgeensis TaxID=1789683 RepID=A0A1X7QX21_9SACH|nr:similar to Saccharomyces cerevisiae YBR133C HSL7 Protein arginine N-methyltransferase that exhibits septin and Hsl1p-dependent bud neck localization and periodic Hsl1p-dependent phosphorylation [Kazachstania saulgeensis]